MLRVLIVDDEEVARISLAEILRLEGYFIKAVSNGQAAVETLRSESFDVMVLDIKMPGMSGIDVMRALVDTLPDMKIIVLTAHGSMDTAIQALRFRVHDYLLKPVLPEQIIESIEAAVANKRNGQDPKANPAIKPQIRFFTFPGGATLDFSKRTIIWKEGLLSLTPTETRLLMVLVDSLGQLITHSQLVLLCQGYKVDNEEAAKILRPVVSRLRQKLLTLPNWDEWIKNVRGAGYVLELPEDHK
jgi:DNA-binding response OmpR family regulator